MREDHLSATSIEPEGIEKKERLWLLSIERRAILPIKWLLFALCAILAGLSSPGPLPTTELFFCLLAFFVTNCFFSYLIYFNRINLESIRPLSYASYAADVVLITVYVYFAAASTREGSEFYILFFLVVLRGSGFFRSTGINIAVNVGVGLVFVATLVATYQEEVILVREFVSKTILLSAIMLLSWFLMEAISTQKRRLFEVNDALIREYDYNQRLLENMADGVIAVDRNLQITAVNDAARQILGLDPRERGPSADPAYPVGGDVLLLPREIAESLRLTLEEEMRLSNHVMEVTTRENESVTLRFSTRTIRGGRGEAVGVVAVFEDISVLRRLEDQMIRSEKLASVGELAAGLAHELGNPISIIKSCASYMRDKWVSATQIPAEVKEETALCDEMDVILSESGRCEKLVKQLLSFAGGTAPHMTRVSVKESVDRAVSLVGYQKESSGIGFRVVCEPEAETVIADESLLDQALVNILLNAVQSMEQAGSITVRAAPFESELPLMKDRRHRWVDISISDEGCGIDRQNLDSIFDPFYTTRNDGTGLGLSITHGVVERMGGSIRVESAPGQGSTFTIRLPARIDDA